MSKPEAWRPGPWTVDSVCGEFHRIYRPNPNGGQLNIARTMYPNDEQSMANAHLIAAAPELYEALERVVQWMDDNGYAPGDQSFGARAALAKARGESQ